MRQANDPMVAADGGPCGDNGGRGRRPVAHWLNIFPAMKLVIWMAALLSLASCQIRPSAKRTPQDDSTYLAHLVPHGSIDSTLLSPREITEPSVVLSWLHCAATVG